MITTGPDHRQVVSMLWKKLRRALRPRFEQRTRVSPRLNLGYDHLTRDYSSPQRLTVLQGLTGAPEQTLAWLACNPKEVGLLRAQRGHEHAYVRANQALLKVRAALVATGLRPGGPVVWEAKLIAGPAPNEPLSPWERVPDGRVRATAEPSANASARPGERQRATKR